MLSKLAAINFSVLEVLVAGSEGPQRAELRVYGMVRAVHARCLSK